MRGGALLWTIRRAVHNDAKTTAGLDAVTRDSQKPGARTRRARTLQRDRISATLPLDHPQPSTSYTASSVISNLLRSLNHHKNPTSIYNTYTSACIALTPTGIPLHIHQLALRKVTPVEKELKEGSVRRPKQSGPRVAFSGEDRLRVVVRNIRAARAAQGSDDTEWSAVDDFNHILRQFAAVGNHLGCLSILSEMANSAILPSRSSIGYTLQAIANRLALPSRVKLREARQTAAKRSFQTVLVMMRERKELVTSMNWDLLMRVAASLCNDRQFKWLLKWGYRIDLQAPDRPVLEKPEVGLLVPPDRPLHFSVASLNALLEWLSRRGDAGKLVSAFEVLTSEVKGIEAYDDQDDDEWGEQSLDGWAYPSTQPNTASYNILLRGVCHFGHTVLARHYLYAAYRLERTQMHARRKKLGEDTPAPTFNVNRDMILSVFGLANRRKHTALMVWLDQRLIPGVLKRKRAEVRKIERTKALKPGTFVPRQPVKGVEAGLAYSPEVKKENFLQRVGLVPPTVDTSPLPPTQHQKFLNASLHIKLLKRDISEIETLRAHIRVIIERTRQRTKEYLGRRVWAAKPIYIPLLRRRTAVPRNLWRNIVSFTPLSPEAQRYQPGRKRMRRMRVIRWRRCVKLKMTAWHRRWGHKTTRPRSRDIWRRWERLRERERVLDTAEQEDAVRVAAWLEGREVVRLIQPLEDESVFLARNGLTKEAIFEEWVQILREREEYNRLRATTGKLGPSLLKTSIAATPRPPADVDSGAERRPNTPESDSNSGRWPNTPPSNDSGLDSERPTPTYTDDEYLFSDPKTNPTLIRRIATTSFLASQGLIYTPLQKSEMVRAAWEFRGIAKRGGTLPRIINEKLKKKRKGWLRFRPEEE
ncbi:hypothetical protein BDZ89DRAFT_1157670 [Hymenopellis radicata]|nr:hypothetical protein BDZ89DRAFT_1157670 [Hymenopellis radicata]